VATRIQGKAIIAELPARAISAISYRLTGRAVDGAMMALRGKEEGVALVEDVKAQQGSFSKAWHAPEEEIVRVRILARFWDDAFYTLERVPFENAHVHAAITVLREAILKRDGLLADDGTIHLPDTP
jgi:hypothetical protein